MDHILLELASAVLLIIITMIASLIIPIIAILYSLFRDLRDIYRAHCKEAKTKKERDQAIGGLPLEIHKKISEKVYEAINITEKLWESIYKWDTDFASLAFTLDFLIIANAAVNNEYFPLLSIIQSRLGFSALAIAILVTMGFFSAYCLTIFLHYMHGSIFDEIDYNLATPFEMEWFLQNKYFIISLIIGIFSFFNAFLIFIYRA